MANIKCAVDLSGLKKLQENLTKLNETQRQEFTESAVKALAERLLAQVIKRTPTGVYNGRPYDDNRKIADGPLGAHTHGGNKVKGKTGGTLRRGWTVGAVKKSGDAYTIEIINPLEYAAYVEYGHKKRNNGWEPGHFMLTTSEKELEKDAPKILRAKLNKLINEAFDV